MHSLFAESLPSGVSISPLGAAPLVEVLRSGWVTYSAAVDACAESLFCFSCIEGSGHATSPWEVWGRCAAMLCLLARIRRVQNSTTMMKLGAVKLLGISFERRREEVEGAAQGRLTEWW